MAEGAALGMALEGMTAANLAYLQGRRSKPRSQRMALRPTPNQWLENNYAWRCRRWSAAAAASDEENQ
jgi:hypothetical protein